MIQIKVFVLAAFCVFAAPSIQANNPDDDERIRLLEDQLARQQEMIEQQQAMLDSMQEELARLKTNRTENSESSANNHPGEPEPASDLMAQHSQLGISGFVALDMINDFDRVAPDYKETLVVSTLPVEDGLFGSDGEFIMSVKQSRLAFNSELDTSFGKVTGLFEFDLFGTGSNAGSTAFNFRQAWLTLGRWGAGQTWSNFMDISTWPNVVDWWGPSGMALNRNPQLRYTVPLGQSSFAVALEKQNASFNVGRLNEIAPGFEDQATAKSEAPDLTAHYRSVHDWGHLQLAGVLRQLSFETLGEPGNEPKGDKTGWGLNLTGAINTVGRDQVKFGLTHGEGIASFMNDGGGSNLVPDFNGEQFVLSAMPSTGMMLYYDHYWNDQWSSSIGFSHNDNDVTIVMTPDSVDQVTYASANLLYKPDNALLMGIEALYGKRENIDGATGTDFRLQFALRYNFSHIYSTR